jgi:hypothetical protein
MTSRHMLLAIVVSAAACVPPDEDAVVSEAASELTLNAITGPFYVRPAITSISPTSGAPGTTVTITGYGFDTLISGPAAFGTTSVAAARAPVTYVSSTQLRVVVPAGGRTGPIYLLSNLTVIGGSPSVQLTSGQTFTVNAPPAAPTGLTARVASDTQVDLSWVDNSWNEGNFQIWMLSGASWVNLGVVPANRTSEPITNLSPGTTVSFRVRAINGWGSSAYSNTVSATTTRTFYDVTVVSATPWSPLAPSANGQTLFHAQNVGAFFDAPPADGVVAGFAAGGLFPRWPDPTNGSPPVQIIREGNLYATSDGWRANLILVAEIPGTGGSNGGSQFVAAHLLVTTNAAGAITGVTPIAVTAGDNTAGFAGRWMIAYQTNVQIAGNLNGRVSGSMTATLFMDEPYATVNGLAIEHHESALTMSFDLPVTPK